ncbi:MAG TPA: winged helix-turn-helix domain-containing protein [Terriglobia bacterium]|nr:winged helix-turn-helix domain-containing protein [Terriglobia bacterium]
MPEAAHSPYVLRFGVFELDLRAGELRKQGLKIRLQEKPLRVLAILLENTGEVVTREELREQLWPPDTFVDFEHSVNTAIKKLREALDDSAENPRFIETLPRHGYRFIGNVEPLRTIRPTLLTEEFHAAPAKLRPSLVSGRTTPDSVLATTARPPPMVQYRRERRRLLAIVAVGAIAVFGALFALNVAGLRDRVLSNGVLLRKIESIAVLPFENLSGNPEQEYFADGMTDELITNLGKFRALRVISRQSVMRYKGSKKPLPEIGRELNVDAIVESTVRTSGGRVRIAAQLIDARNDRQLWAQTYERDLGDVLVLQSEVARAIASQIRIKVTSQERARMAATRPVDPEAHRCYLLGRFYWNKRTEEGFNKAIGFFQRSIEIDPTYAPAYAGVADCYNLIGDYHYLRPRDAYPKAKEAARKALQIDESSAEAHTSLAYPYFDYDWDWASSEKEYKRAFELNPNYATAHQWYSEYLTAMGRHAEAVAESKRARELDPLSPAINLSLAHRYWFMRQYDTEIRGLQETLQLFPEFANAYGTLAYAYLATGRHQEAISALQKCRSLSGASPAEVVALGEAYAKGGVRGFYLYDLRRLMEESKHRYVRPVYIARLHAFLGENDEAFSYLEKAYEEREWHLTRLQVDPVWDPLRSDPRFQDLVRRMNFPP